jgi:DNA topoisomerase-2
MSSDNEMSVEDKYVKLSHLEHILKRPDTYVGIVKSDKVNTFIYSKEEKQFILKEIELNQGLYKIYDECVVNARDQSVRDSLTSYIDISIDQKNNLISICNDGTPIPIQIHKEYNMYVPELIFGNLLTSSNFSDNGKTVGGKNGYGAKLINIFSKKFIIEIVEKNKKYYQEFTNNMSEKSEPVIEKVKGVKSYTKISFSPDLEKFGYTELTNDIVSLFETRIYHLAGTTRYNLNVILNGEKINIHSFKDYIQKYYSEDSNTEIIYEHVNTRWEIGCVFDPNSGFRQISFVNGIHTSQGGTHVEYIVNQIVKYLTNYIQTKKKIQHVRPSVIKDNLTIFINSVVEDPSFTSQTKDYLCTKPDLYGSTCPLSETFMKQLIKSGIVEEIVNVSKAKELNSLKKTDGSKNKKVFIPKLEDAKNAGSAKSKDCVLVLSEGDSAKGTAMILRQVEGSDNIGVFPLKGKLLNVREASIQQLEKNEEIINIKKILGLKQGVTYKDVSQLRYGKILILTDQDYDGSHIKGLIINFIHYFWPSLLTNVPGFIQSFSTPIIKAFKQNDKKKENAMKFYTIKDYKDWVDSKLNGSTKGWVIKYYKGLGTLTDKEAHEEFLNFNQNVYNFLWDDHEEKEEDSSSEDRLSKSYDAITLAFSKNRSNDRKLWLKSYDPNNILNVSSNRVSLYDFIEKDLKHFSNSDNIRSIPNLCDGLKPSQRKVLYSAFKKGIKHQEIKVAQFAAYVSEVTNYHHGEASLQGTIVNMAQDYVNSNNINLLLPNGNFGHRHIGGHDAGSARYIFTQENPVTSYLFPKADEPLLNQIEEEGEFVEPEFYVPILPTVLVNGTCGIGTGYSTSIPQFNPLDIVENIKHKLNQKDMKEIIPWYRGFKGKFQKVNDSTYQCHGVYKIIDDRTVHVTEIPISMWINNYKEFLEDSLDEKPKKDDDKKKSKKGFIESYENDSGNNYIDFKIRFPLNVLQELIKSNTLDKKLKLVENISLNNMHLYNTKFVITKYKSPNDIIEEFFDYRFKFYEKRKAYQIKVLQNYLNILKYKRKFIEYFMVDKIKLYRRTKEDIISDLVKYEFPKLSNRIDVDEDDKSYDYITAMGLFSLTKEKMEDLEKEIELKQAELDNYMKLTIKELWLKELNDFEVEYQKYLKSFEEEDLNKKTKTKKTRKTKN